MLRTIPPFTPKLQPVARALADAYAAAFNANHTSAAIALLEQIAALGDVTALPALMKHPPHARKQSPWFNRSELVEPWNAAAARLLRLLPPHGYFWLNNQRQWLFEPDAIPADPWLTVLATFSGNGFVREAGLRSLDCVRPEAAAAQIVRLTDWVEPVRRFAAANLSSLLDIAAIPAQWLAECAPLLLDSEAHRNADPALLTRLIGALAADDAALRSAVVRSDRRISRASSIIAARLDPLRRREMLGAGLAPADPIVRQHWAEIGLRDTEPEVRALVCTLIADERNPAIRILWLDTLLRDQPEQALAALRRDLLARSGALRQYCQYQLHQAGVDAPAIYRAVLDAPISRDTAAALKGLDECGAAGDIDYGLFYADADPPAIRQAALLLIGRRGAVEQRDLLWAALDDPAPKVARTAASILRRQTISAADWQAKYARATIQTRHVLLGLARRLPWNDRREAYRALLADPDLSAAANQAIGRDPIARSYGTFWEQA